MTSNGDLQCKVIVGLKDTVDGKRLLYPKKAEAIPVNKDVIICFVIQFQNGNFKFVTYKERLSMNLLDESEVSTENPITSFLVQCFVNTKDTFPVNVGVQDLTSGLATQMAFKNCHENLIFKTEFEIGEPSTLYTINGPTEAPKTLIAPDQTETDKNFDTFDSYAEIYSQQLQAQLKKYKPRILGAYGIDFAKSVHLYYAPSEFSRTRGEQVRISPLLHFVKHRTFSEGMLKKLAKMAYMLTYTYDGEIKPNISVFAGRSASTWGTEHSCFLTNVFARYLALLANMVKYEYDYNFDLKKKDNNPRVTDMFGDCLMGFTGDCEDASRLVADVWRSTSALGRTEDLYLRVMKNMVPLFKFYATLCTIQSSTEMAHCTCILVPKNPKGDFPFAIVEGTNMISPFAATGRPASLEKKIYKNKIEDFREVHEELMAKPKNTEERVQKFKKLVSQEAQNQNTSSLFFLAEKPTLISMQARVGLDDKEEGRAKATGWYGLFHEGFEIIPTKDVPVPVIFTKKKFYGVSAEEMMRGDYKTEIIQAPLSDECLSRYRKLTDWRKKVAGLVRWDGDIQFEGLVNDVQVEEEKGLPVLMVEHMQLDPATGFFPEIFHSEKFMTLSNPNSDVNRAIRASIYYIGHSINQAADANQSGSAESRVPVAMSTAASIMAPFGAAAKRPLYPCSDSSMVAAVASEYQRITGEKLKLVPHMPVGDQIEQQLTGCMKHTSGKAHRARKYRTPTMSKAHPLSGQSGNLIEALMALKIGEPLTEMDAQEKVLHTSVDDVKQTAILNSMLTAETDHQKHMESLEFFAKQNDKHPLSPLIKKYNTKKNHGTLLKLVNLVRKEAGALARETGVENLTEEAFHKAKTLYESGKEEVDDFSHEARDAWRKVRAQISAALKELNEAGDVDEMYSQKKSAASIY